MPDASLLASDTRPQATSLTSESGSSVNINVQRGRNTGSDVVGFTVEQVSTPLRRSAAPSHPGSSAGAAPIWASMLSPGQGLCSTSVPINA